MTDKPISKAKLARVKQCLERVISEITTMTTDLSVFTIEESIANRLEAMQRDAARTLRLLNK